MGHRAMSEQPKQILECEVCGTKENTLKCLDPYDRDVNNVEVSIVLCENCNKQRCDDI